MFLLVFLFVSLGLSTSTCSTVRNYNHYRQCDSQWGNNRLGSSGTVCSIGCLMSSVSMALNGLGVTINGQSSNPGTLNSYLNSNGGYYGNLFIWTSTNSISSKMTYQGKLYSTDDIAAQVCNGHVLILNVNNGGHWVLATGVKYVSGVLYFETRDPGTSTSVKNYRASEVSQAGYYKVTGASSGGNNNDDGGSSGSYLCATTGLNMRSSPGGSIGYTCSAGDRFTWDGTQSCCTWGYTWYKLGNGYWAASNYLEPCSSLDLEADGVEELSSGTLTAIITIPAVLGLIGLLLCCVVGCITACVCLRKKKTDDHRYAKLETPLQTV